jgi:hypothetical protein
VSGSDLSGQGLRNAACLLPPPRRALEAGPQIAWNAPFQTGRVRTTSALSKSELPGEIFPQIPLHRAPQKADRLATRQRLRRVLQRHGAGGVLPANDAQPVHARDPGAGGVERQPEPVVPQHLDQIAAAAAQNEQIARMRVATEPFLDQDQQAVHALAHVGHATRQPDPDARRNRDHRRTRTRSAAVTTARALAHPALDEATKMWLRALQQTCDPVLLLAEIRAAQAELGERIDQRGTGAIRQVPAPVQLDRFVASLKTAWRQGEQRPTHQRACRRRKPVPKGTAT